MIRTFWGYLNLVLATIFFGAITIGAALLRVRGPIYDWVARQWSEALLWATATKIRPHGLERVDWSKPHIVVSNHIAGFDILALAVTIPARYHFVAKKELERVPIFGRAWKSAGHISIDRSNRQRAIESLKNAADLMRSEGGIVIIFPEGTRSRTGEMLPFKKGAFMLAIEAGVPIVPVVVVGSDKVNPSDSIRITPGVIDLYFDEPLEVGGYERVDVDELILHVRGRMNGMLEAYSTGPPGASGAPATRGPVAGRAD